MPFDVHYDPSLANDQRLTLNVVVPDGGRFEIDARGGDRVIDRLKAYGFPLRAECFGEREPANCQVQVGLRLRGAEGAAALAWPGRSASNIDGLHPLGQLVMSADLDGLEVRLGHDVLVQQTFWAAG